MNLYPLIPLLAWMITVFVWGYVYGQRRRGPMAKTFLAFSGVCAVWLNLELLFHVPALRGTENLILRAIGPLWISVGALFMTFAYHLVGRPLDRMFRIIVVATAAGAVFHLSTDLALAGHVRHPWGVADLRDPFWHSLLCVLPVTGGAWGLWLVLRERQRTRRDLPRRHLGLVFYGGLLTMGLVILLNIALPNFFGILDMPRFGSSAMALFVLVVFRAVTRHRFLAIDVEQVAGELFEDAADGIALVDDRGRVQRVNRAGRELLGVGAVPEDGIALARMLPGYAAEVFGSREFRVASSTGGERIIASSQTPSTGTGAGRGLILTLRDVTEERRAEEAQRRTREELEREIESRSAELRRSQQVETLGVLAGGVAHDLHNLLAAILGFSTAARDDLAPGHPLRADLDEVIDAGRRARDIVQQLLAFSRKERPERRPLVATSAVEQSLALVGSALPPTIELRRDLDAGDAQVVAAGDALHQIIVNLANNAHDAMRAAGGTLTVTLVRTALDAAAADALRPGLEPGHYLRLAVADTGEGMDAEVRERIFEPFFTTRQEQRRTGLGLVIVERIVREHLGAVAVRSEPGRGTEVAVFLPLARAGHTAGAPEEVAG